MAVKLKVGRDRASIKRLPLLGCDFGRLVRALQWARPCKFGDPSPVRLAPSGAMWWHEIKHDGYRLMVRRTPDGVRIRTRRSYDWTHRFPLVVEVATGLRATSFVLGGEGVILKPLGVSDFR